MAAEDVLSRVAKMIDERLPPEQLRQAVDQMLEPLSILKAVRDESGSLMDFEWIYINRAGAEDVELDVEDMLGSRLLELLPAHREGLFDAYANVVETGEPLNIQDAGYDDDWGSGEVQSKVFDIRAVKVGDGFAVSWTDKTAQKLAQRAYESEEEARQVSQQVFETVFMRAPIGMAVVGLDGSFLRANPALCAMVGYSADRLESLTFQDITHPEDLDLDVRLAGELAEGLRDNYRIDKRYYDSEGHVVWVGLSASMVRDSDGTPLHYIAQIEDISQRKRDEDLLRQLAQRDELTGAYNRRKFDEELLRAEALVRRHQEMTAAVLMIDVDRLKQVNDTRGHEAGDQYLQEVARVIQERIRLTDTFARYGGDEFALLLLRVTEDQARLVAHKLVLAARESAKGSVSIGFAMLSAGSSGALAQADAAMYEAKRAGGGRVVGPGPQERSAAQ